jgi:hypothetical protein
MGRNLFCQEFKKGRELSDHNAHVKNRRVIVKKVPSYFSEHKLLELIQARVGAVDTIYEFKTDSQNLSTLSKRFKSFSVSFRQPETLECIPGSFAISLPDSHHHILIEKFEQRLSKESEGGSDRSASDHYLSSQSDLQSQPRLFGTQNRAGENTPVQRFSAKGKSAHSGELGKTTCSSGQHHKAGLERGGLFISAGLQHSAPTLPERHAISLSTAQTPSGRPRGVNKNASWLSSPTVRSDSNLRFNILRVPLSHPSQQPTTY